MGRDRVRERAKLKWPSTARPALLGYISPEPARLNGNTFPAVNLPSDAALTETPETQDRFARDLRGAARWSTTICARSGSSWCLASAPDFFLEDTPTAVLVRQVLGAISQFEKASLVAKLKAARDRKREATGKCGGRRTLAEARPETVALAKELHGQRLSLRKISAALAERGHVTGGGKPYTANMVQTMLRRQ